MYEDFVAACLDLSQDADRDLEREATVFGAELLMPEAAVREAWAEVPDAREVAARFEEDE